jgi:hypothetical protein
MGTQSKKIKKMKEYEIEKNSILEINSTKAMGIKKK